MNKPKYFKDQVSLRHLETALKLYRSYGEALAAGAKGSDPEPKHLASQALKCMGMAVYKTGKKKFFSKPFNKGPDGLGNTAMKLIAMQCETTTAFALALESRIDELRTDSESDSK